MTIDENIVKFRDALESFGVFDTSVAVEDFKKMLTYKFAPDMVWQILAFGAFKECYDIGSDKVVVKFASNCNQTDNERFVVAEAKEEGFGDIFIPSIFIPLAVSLPISYLEQAEGYYNSRNEYVYYDDMVELDYVIIQPRIESVAGDDNPVPYGDKNKYYANPIIKPNGDTVPYTDIYYSHVEDMTWIQIFINKYGYERFAQLEDFLDRLSISDLHNKNVGFLMNGSPVIFDWLS